MYSIVRTAALELQTVNNKEVVKVAGIVNRLRNIFKRITNQEYSDSVSQLRSDSGIVQVTADQLQKRITELTESITDGDVEAYDVALQAVRDLTADLAAELKKLNRDAKENDPGNLENSSAEKPKAVEEIPDDPGFIKNYTNDMIAKDKVGIWKQLRKQMPKDHDVPFGRHSDHPKLKSFNWFQQFQPNDIDIPGGAKHASQNNLFDGIVSLLLRVTNLPEKLDENSIEEFVRSKWASILDNLRVAILNGSLYEYQPARQSTNLANRPAGQMYMEVYTAPFEIIPDVMGEAKVIMYDLTPSHPATKKLVVAMTKFWRATANGVSVNLRMAPVRRKSTSQSKASPKEDLSVVEKPEKKTSAIRLEYLKQLIKNSGIDFSAAKHLPDSFWANFVKMCDRLGAKPEDLARVINSESGFDPHAMNIQGGRVIAKGLNQLIEKTAKSLGMSNDEWNSYENTPAEEQLKYVEKYFRNVGKATGQDGKWESATQLYVANFAPKYVHKASNPNAVLYNSAENHAEYAQNKGLDRDKKGSITAGDLAHSVQGRLPDYIASAIQKAKQGNEPLAENTKLHNDNDNVSSLLDALVATGPVEKMVRNALLKNLLPTSNVLVSISTLSAPFSTRMKFAKSVATVLKEIIDAETTIHSNGNKIELECSASGSYFAVSSAIKALCDCVSDGIKIKYNKLEIRSVVIPSTISKYAKVG